MQLISFIGKVSDYWTLQIAQAIWKLHIITKIAPSCKSFLHRVHL